MLDAIQQRQEDDYSRPYHWFTQPETIKGRIYFGYMGLCADLLEKLSGGAKSEARILDAGCGDGRFLGFLASRGYARLQGADYSERALAFARLFLPQAQFQRADLTQPLPFEDGSFDVVFLIETLEHIKPEEIPAIIRNLRRVVKPSGRLIVTVPSVLQPLSVDGKHYQHFSQESLTGALESEFTVEEMRGQDKHGFHPLKYVYFLLDNPWWTIPPLLAWYNLKVWPKRFNACEASNGRRLIAVAKPK